MAYPNLAKMKANETFDSQQSYIASGLVGTSVINADGSKMPNISVLYKLQLMKVSMMLNRT